MHSCGWFYKRKVGKTHGSVVKTNSNRKSENWMERKPTQFFIHIIMMFEGKFDVLGIFCAVSQYVSIENNGNTEK